MSSCCASFPRQPLRLWFQPYTHFPNYSCDGESLHRAPPYWAALLAVVSPFLLWFGQEARPYALWALLATLSTYLLLRLTAPNQTHRMRWAWGVGYGLVVVVYLDPLLRVLLLPIHAILVYLGVRAERPKLAALFATLIALAGALILSAAFWYIIVRQQAGADLRHVPWDVLLPDVLNAYSLGLSVDISQVLYLDMVLRPGGSGRCDLCHAQP